MAKHEYQTKRGDLVWAADGRVEFVESKEERCLVSQEVDINKPLN